MKTFNAVSPNNKYSGVNNMRGWNVYLHGKWIDTVFFTKDCGITYVYASLVNHDGYDPNIDLKSKGT